MRALILALILTLSVSLLPGCNPPKITTDSQVGERVRNIDDSADRSIKLADDAAIEAPVIAPKMTQIVVEQKAIKTNAADINKEHEKTISASGKDINRLKKENADLKSKSEQMYSRWIATIIIGATLVCFVSLALLLLGYIKNINLTVIAASVVLGGIALKFMMAYVMWIGLGVVIIVAGCIAYSLWRHKQALKQTVKTVEETKPLIADDQVFKTTADGIQNKSTKTIVDVIQNTLTREKERVTRIDEGRSTILDRVINKFQ